MQERIDKEEYVKEEQENEWWLFDKLPFASSFIIIYKYENAVCKGLGLDNVSSAQDWLGFKTRCGAKVRETGA